MPEIKQLVTDFSLQKSRFNPRAFHIRFMVDKVTNINFLISLTIQPTSHTSIIFFLIKGRYNRPILGWSTKALCPPPSYKYHTFNNIKCLTSSRNLTGVLKLGFFLAFCITDEYRMCPAHSMSTLGLSTVMRCIRFKSRSPQKSTSILWVQCRTINLRL